jgi:DNA-binding CsgD family transcriptional regulator
MNGPVTLSPRQREIVVMVGRDGLPWVEVARQLDISPSTVRSHVRTILQRIGSRRLPREALVELYWRREAPDPASPLETTPAKARPAEAS